MKEDNTGKVRLAATIKDLIAKGQLYEDKCTHMIEVQDVTPSAGGCEDCLKTGDKWVHLRLCLTCGHVGCCDDSKNKHATKHYHRTKHPMIASYQPDEDWIWCYVDEVGVDLQKIKEKFRE